MRWAGATRTARRFIVLVVLLIAVPAGLTGPASASSGSRFDPTTLAPALAGSTGDRSRLVTSTRSIGGTTVSGYVSAPATPVSMPVPPLLRRWLRSRTIQPDPSDVLLPERQGAPWIVASGPGANHPIVTLRAIGGANQAAGLDQNRVVFRDAYRSTDQWGLILGQQAIQLLVLKDKSAPTRFVYELNAPGAKVARVAGGVRIAIPGATPLLIADPRVLAPKARGRSVVPWQVVSGSASGPARLILDVSRASLREPALLAFSAGPAPDMVQPHADAASALLPNGQVMVAGGFSYSDSGPGVTDLAEFYDPSQNYWQIFDGSFMAVPREDATATPLKDGRVLVVGGFNYANGPLQPLATSEIYDANSGSFGDLANLNELGRFAHTATLLSNGRVLVAGGCCDPNGQPLSTAEVFDPTTGGWLAVGNLTDPRAYATATLLSNGQVLVAGGCCDPTGNPWATAEVFNPQSNAWTTVGSMAAGRLGHTATLLSNGQVLVAGGCCDANQQYLSSAELYNPATGSWSSTGSLATARILASANLLPSGTVAVVGGVDTTGALLASVEAYDPSSGTWQAASSLATARSNQNAVLLPNSQILVAGGWGSDREISGITPLFSAELLDFRVPTWSSAGDANATGRDSHTATLLPNGQVLVTGGKVNSYIAIANWDVFDPNSGTWVASGLMPQPRDSHTATLLANGKVLIAGGENSGDPVFDTEIYDPATKSITVTGNMITPRWDHTATLLANGKVLVAGGTSDGFSGLASAELYDPSTGVWSATGSMSIPRLGHTATLLQDGRVLVAGGQQNLGSSAVDSSELYDPSTGTWSTTPNPLFAPRSFHTATLLEDGSVLVAGGDLGSPDGIAEIWDPSTEFWSNTLGNLNDPRQYAAATLLPDGRVLIAGGQSPSGATLDSAEIYDPTTGVWSLTSSMSTNRQSFSATMLPSGDVFVFGGSTGPEAPDAATVEQFDAGLGLGFGQTPPNRPSFGTVASSVAGFGSLTASGALSFGVSEASGGNGPQASASNLPVVQVRSLANDEILQLGTTGWNESSYASEPFLGLPPGYLLVTMFANGVPSVSQIIQVTRAPTTTTLQTFSPLSPAPGQSTSAQFVVTGPDFPDALVLPPFLNFSFQPSGTATVSDELGESCSTDVQDGSCALVPGEQGQRTVAASYSGDLVYAPSVSAPAELFVDAVAPCTGFPPSTPTPVSCSASSNSWTQVSPMPDPLAQSAAAAGLDGLIYVAGGNDFSTASQTFETYNLNNDTWTDLTTTSPVPTAVSQAAAAVGPDNSIYVAGGVDTSGNANELIQAYRFNSSGARIWDVYFSLTVPRAEAVAAAGPDGRIYVIGGTSNPGPTSTALNSVDVFDPTALLTTAGPPMPTARYAAAAARGWDGRIYVFGGTDGTNDLNVVEVYDTVSQSWSCSIGDSNCPNSAQTLKPMPVAREGAAAAVGQDGRIYLFGGTTNGFFAFQPEVDAYDPSSNTWSMVQPIQSEVTQASAAQGWDGRDYVIGGEINGEGLFPVSIVQVYQPQPAASTPTPVNTPTPTFTITPTMTPTITPTLTLTPTPTETQARGVNGFTPTGTVTPPTATTIANSLGTETPTMTLTPGSPVIGPGTPTLTPTPVSGRIPRAYLPYISNGQKPGY